MRLPSLSYVIGTYSSVDAVPALAGMAAAVQRLRGGNGGAAAAAASVSAAMSKGQRLPVWVKELLGMDEDLDEQEREGPGGVAEVLAAVEAAERAEGEEEERVYHANPLHAQGACREWDVREGRVVYTAGVGGWALLPGWQQHREGRAVHYLHAESGRRLDFAPLHDSPAPVFIVTRTSTSGSREVLHLDGGEGGRPLKAGWVPAFEEGSGRYVYVEEGSGTVCYEAPLEEAEEEGVAEVAASSLPNAVEVAGVDTEVLLAGWRAAVQEGTGQRIYVEAGSGRVSHEAPLVEGLPEGVDALERFECVDGRRYFWSDGRRTEKAVPGGRGRAARLLAWGWRRCVLGGRALFVHADGRVTRRPDFVH